jgi:hypothetical protein
VQNLLDAKATLGGDQFEEHIAELRKSMRDLKRSFEDAEMVHGLVFARNHFIASGWDFDPADPTVINFSKMIDEAHLKALGHEAARLDGVEQSVFERDAEQTAKQKIYPARDGENLVSLFERYGTQRLREFAHAMIRRMIRLPRMRVEQLPEATTALSISNALLRGRRMVVAGLDYD